MGQASRRWSPLAQALYTPGLHSPSTCYCTLQRGKSESRLSLQSHSGSPGKPKKEPLGALDETCKAREVRIGCVAVQHAPSEPAFQRCVHLSSLPKVWLFKHSAETLVPYLGIETEAEHFRKPVPDCLCWFPLKCESLGPILLSEQRSHSHWNHDRGSIWEKHCAFQGRSMKYFTMSKSLLVCVSWKVVFKTNVIILIRLQLSGVHCFM